MAQSISRSPDVARKEDRSMYAKKVNERSPLRVFERSIHGGLGQGNLGVVLSRPGMGKSSFLVGIALDDLMRGRRVFHVALE